MKNVHPQIKQWWASGKEPTLLQATRQGLGTGLLQSKDKNLLVLTADLAKSTALSDFIKKHPNRFFDVGVAEQALAGISAGLASEGLTVIATSFAVFNPGRNWDFIRSQIALSSMPVVIVGSHAGLATGPDGATHQALEDVALLRSFPTMTIISPADATEAALATDYAIKSKSPVYLRLVRQKTPLITDNTLRKARWLLQGSTVTLVSTGVTTWQALKAAKLLKQQKISASILHLPFLSPVSKQALKKISTKYVVSIEDHNINGGLGSILGEFIAENGLKAKLLRIGTTSFGQSGSYDELYKKYGLDEVSIVKKVRKLLGK